MYKIEVFDLFYELTNFLNDNHIAKSDIIKICKPNDSTVVILIYFDSEVEE